LKERAALSLEFSRGQGFPGIDDCDVVAQAGHPQRIRELIGSLGSDDKHISPRARSYKGGTALMALRKNRVIH
jgi:hypothetical protein